MKIGKHDRFQYNLTVNQSQSFSFSHKKRYSNHCSEHSRGYKNSLSSSIYRLSLLERDKEN